MTPPPTPTHTNKLHFGDNLPIMREHIPNESVDLIYLDPPFRRPPGQRRSQPSSQPLL